MFESIESIDLSFGVEELEVMDVHDASALPEMGASSSVVLCCSSSSSSSCTCSCC